jgi:hypothetical protein
MVPGQCTFFTGSYFLREILKVSSEVADKYPSGKATLDPSSYTVPTDLLPASVTGVDLYPPPVAWVPANCVFEVDDVTQAWTWRKKFDLIHMRLLLGAFTPTELDQLYQKCFKSVCWI